MDEKKPTIKERLNERFFAAREIVGPSWRRDLANSDPFFNTKTGTDWMDQAASGVSDPRRISNDRLERIVDGLEALVASYKSEEA